MKSTIKNNPTTPKQDIIYPCLMKNNKHPYIVLFKEAGSGMVVWSEYNCWSLGEYCLLFDMNDFSVIPNDAEIILSNNNY